MAVRIKDLLDLAIMKDFSVVAGEKGLNRVIETTEILDFEFTSEGEAYRKSSFEGKSIVLSVLLFAKDRPELILEAVKKLIAQNVQALAYKPVFFKELPQEALDYADEMNFPVLEFGHDEFFEDVIIAVRDLIHRDSDYRRTELLIGQMLEGDLSPDENEAVSEEINPFFRPLITAIFAEAEPGDAERAERLIQSGSRLRSGAFITRYREAFLIVLSQDEKSDSGFSAQLMDVLTSCGLTDRVVSMGISGIHEKSAFDRTVREAFWTWKTAKIEKENVKFYKDLGIYKLIISHINSESTSEYMNDYLLPLFEEEGREGELLKTAAEYVLAGGDIGKTAERLFCHKNTIRYRISKLQEKLDPEADEKAFFLNLSAAIKIYLLLNEKK